MKDFLSDGNSPVCFFDSGIGGLTLLSRCSRLLPDTQFVYFADNFNVPYGNLSQARLIEKVDGIFENISSCNPKAVVIACNTVTAQCALYLRSKYDFPIIGIQPAVKPAAQNVKCCRVLATPSTAESKSIKNLIEEYGNGVTEVVACPCLASYIEQNVFNLNSDVLDLLPEMLPDSIVLGCTHYIFIKKLISERYNCPVFDGVEGTVHQLCRILGFDDHFFKKNYPLSSTTTVFSSDSLKNVRFSGGDEQKNKCVFEFIMRSSK